MSMTAILGSVSSADLVSRVALTTCVAVINAAAAALWPRVAYRLAVPAGDPPHPACRRCGRVFALGLRGWAHLGSACPRCPTSWWALSGGVAVASAALTWQLADQAASYAVLLIGWIAIVHLGAVLSLIDLQVMRLPTPLVAGLAMIVAISTAATAMLSQLPGRIVTAVLAGAGVGGLYLLIAIVSPRMIGLGDVRLAAVLSTALGATGWLAVALGGVLPYILALPFAVTQRKRHDGSKVDLPFGPFLLAGAVLAMILTSG
jgi:leader peptidase (prepilin peptidase)/N-methyltransferase